MKLRGRTLLVLALLIFGGYAIYDYRHDQNREKHAAEEALLLTVNSEQVDSVSLEKQGQKILLKRTVDGWNLEEPFKDLADNTAVEDLIKSVASEKIIDVAKEGENIDWSIFGLDKPLGTITFATNAGAKNVFQISSKRNFEENALARRDSEKRVLIINSVWQNRMNKTPLDFRDRRVLRHRMASIDSFKLKNEKGLMELVLQEGKWIAPAKKNLKLDQNKVHEILQSIADAKAAEYVEGALPALKALFTLDLKLAEKNWTVQVGQAKDFKIYAQVSDPKFNLRLEPGALDRLIKLSVEDLQEGSPTKGHQNSVEDQSAQLAGQKEKK